MKFNINKQILLEELEKIQGPTTTKQNFLVLNSVLIEVKENKLQFTTTDLDLTIISKKEANIQKEGKILVPMRRFISIIRELPNQDIDIEENKNILLIKCEQIEFKINILNYEEFPKIEKVEKTSFIKIDSNLLKEAIKLTSFCVGYEDISYVLSGIFFEIYEDQIRLVSTDGKRLAVSTQKLPKTQANIKTKISFILPIRAINELDKLIKDIDSEILLSVEENRVIFEINQIQYLIRPIEGEFPNYSQYIPKEGKDKLKINREIFLSGLKRAELLSTNDYQGVKLQLKKDQLLILKSTPELGEVKEIINSNYTGQDLEIGFNPKYIIDVLKNLKDEEVIFEFFGQEKPAVLRKEDYLYLVLPLKI